VDWVDTFLNLTDGTRSPRIFRLWAAIATISGILQRRVFTYTEAHPDPLAPNLFVVLTGKPASGKGISIGVVRHLWTKVKGMYIAPDNPTKASFFSALASATRLVTDASGEIHLYSALSAPIFEFSVFIPRYDLEFISDLSLIWDNPPKYDKPRTSVESYDIDNPTLNLIAGVTPDLLGALLPEAAWGQGITSRLLFIYSNVESYNNSSYFRRRDPVELDKQLVPPLIAAFDLCGEFEWSPEAQEAHINWLDAGKPGAPQHARLEHYASRRDTHIMKLSMISAVSSGKGLFVEIDDYERAHAWLSEAELAMPDVFRAMIQKSDDQVIADLHFAAYTHYVRRPLGKRIPIEDEFLWEFLKDKVTSMAIPRIIETAEKSGMFRRATGVSANSRPKWIPKAFDSYVRPPSNQGA
jgi:hypothetical protein